MRSVLFVCTANICRSPMAMGLLRKKIGNSQEWRIESAGTWSIVGEPAAWNTQVVLAKRGVDIHDHRSRSVSLEMLKDFNLILVMEAGHKEALNVEFPEIADKVYMVSEMVGAMYNIPDPVGSLLDGFEETAQEFELIFNTGFEKICHLADL